MKKSLLSQHIEGDTAWRAYVHRPLVADLAKSVGEFLVLRPPYFHVAKEMRGGGDDVYFSSPSHFVALIWPY